MTTNNNFLFDENYNDLRPLEKRSFYGRYYVNRTDYELEPCTFKFKISFYLDVYGTTEIPAFSYKTPCTTRVRYWPIDNNIGRHKYTSFSLDNIVIPNDAKLCKIEAILGETKVTDTVSFDVISDSR